MSDVAVPIVFPDYLIRVDIPRVSVDVPDWIPGIPNHITIPGTTNRVPYLGHAGILFFNGRGSTKYYEYGRYDRANLGLVRRHPIRDIRIRQNGQPTLESLRAVLQQISQLAGQGGRITGAYIELTTTGAFGRMLVYAESRMRENTNPHRTPYDLISNSCLHFMKQIAEAGGARMPSIVDPRPAGYMDRVRSSFPDLDYQSNTLNIEGIRLQ